MRTLTLQQISAFSLPIVELSAAATGWRYGVLSTRHLETSYPRTFNIDRIPVTATLPVAACMAEKISLPSMPLKTKEHKLETKGYLNGLSDGCRKQCDVDLIFEGRYRFPCHSVVLRQYSKVIDTMLEEACDQVSSERSSTLSCQTLAGLSTLPSPAQRSAQCSHHYNSHVTKTRSDLFDCAWPLATGLSIHRAHILRPFSFLSHG